MPFTLSHAAAALPFRRTRLVPSALVVGTIAPDLEYFIRLASGGGWGHTMAGAFAMDLPVGLGTLWLFHRLAKLPVANLLPDGVRARLGHELSPFHFGPLRRFLLILISLLIGIATHVLWDSFTHPQYWIVRHWSVLNHVHRYPIIGWQTNCGILWSLSSLGGVVLLGAWFVWWYGRKAPDPTMSPSVFTTAQRRMVVGIICVAAGLGACARAFIGVGMPRIEPEYGDFAQEVVVTFGALCWWQLVMWGVVGPFRSKPRIASRHREHADSRYADSRVSLEP